MIPRSYKINGIILGRRNYKEADRVITILTCYHGKKILLARGVRKTSSQRGPKLEEFNQVRAQVHRGKTWDILGETVVLQNFSSFKKSLKKVSFAYEICEMVDKIVPEEEKNKEIFDLLKRSLHKLNQTDIEDLDDFLAFFKVKLLSLSGFWPDDKEIAKNKIDPFIESIIHSKIKSKCLRL